MGIVFVYYWLLEKRGPAFIAQLLQQYRGCRVPLGCRHHSVYVYCLACNVPGSAGELVR